MKFYFFQSNINHSALIKASRLSADMARTQATPNKPCMLSSTSLTLPNSYFLQSGHSVILLRFHISNKWRVQRGEKLMCLSFEQRYKYGKNISNIIQGTPSLLIRTRLLSFNFLVEFLFQEFCMTPANSPSWLPEPGWDWASWPTDGPALAAEGTFCCQIITPHSI